MFSYFDLRFPSCACFPGFPRPVQTLKECGRGFVRDAIATNAINVRSSSPTASKMTKKGESNGEKYSIRSGGRATIRHSISYLIVIDRRSVSAFCFGLLFQIPRKVGGRLVCLRGNMFAFSRIRGRSLSRKEKPVSCKHALVYSATTGLRNKL